MFNLSYNDHRPIYEQLKDRIKQLILGGALTLDAKLPSVRELALQLAINPNTIQRAYRELEAEGYIYSVRAKGNFVAPISKITIQKHCDELFCSLDQTVRELAYAGVEAHDVILRVEAVYNHANMSPTSKQ